MRNKNSNLYLETSTEMDKSIPSGEVAKSLANEQSKQSSSTLETSNIPGSHNQLQETDECDDSAAESEDVKVCDICGDAGVEELLAICSRCSDGAEHTYCMQKKLKELPKGDWLCEECKLKEENENQNDAKLETVAKTLQVQPLNKSMHNTNGDFDPKCMPELNTKAIELEEMGTGERPQSPQLPDKEEKNLEVDLKNSKRIFESSGVSTRTVDAKNKSTLSCEGSFRDLVDKAKKVKPAAVFGGQSVNNSSFARSQTFSGPNSSKMLDPVQSSRGPLSKSVSFNNSNIKPKVQFIESVPHKKNMSKESNDTRKGLWKRLGESASFKSMRLGNSSAEFLKTQSLHPSQAEDHGGLKERNMAEKKIATTECALINPALMAGVGNLHSKGDLEVGIVSEPKVLDIKIGPHDKDESGCNEMKSSCVTKNFGWSSSISTSQMSCLSAPKEDNHDISGVADKSCIIPNASLQRIAPQVVDRIKDSTSIGTSKQTASGGGGLLRCKKCNETGHPTQFCSIDKFPVSALKPSAGRNTSNLHHRSNKTKDAADVPIFKSTIQKDGRLPVPSANSSYEVPSKDLRSGSSSVLGNSSHLKRTAYDQDNVKSSASDTSKTSASVNLNLHGVHVEASSVHGKNSSSPTDTILDQLNTKSLLQDSLNVASVPADIRMTSVIPKLEFIWQGGFEVLKSGRLSKSCEGVQAHLSTSASPKVLEAATKFPCKVQVEEVTYLSSWPLQHQGHSPGEHNIALFFFAKDIESYEKTYSKLLDDMIKNDLALKGNIAGAELLVFPSNKLPQNFQRWNRLFFLWGVFRGRRPNSENPPQSMEKPLNPSLSAKVKPPQSMEKPLNPSLNAKVFGQDLPIPIPEVSVPDKLNDNGRPDKEMSICNRSSELKEFKSILSENIQSTSRTGSQMNAVLMSSGVETEKNFDSEDREVNPSYQKEKMEKGSLMKSELFWGNNPGEELTDSRPSRKRSLLTPIEIMSHATEATINESINLNEEVDLLPDDDRREHKKMKPESEHISCSHQEGNFSSSLSSKAHPLASSFSSHGFNMEALPGNPSIDESCLFPVKLGPVSDTLHKEVIQYSDGEGSADTPDLELALGAKKKEMPPPASPNARDDMAASLSLSLAFHPMEKEPKVFTSI